MRRRLTRTALLTVLGLLVASLLIELGFQVVEATPPWRILPVSEISLYGPDDFTGYRHRADARGVWLKEHRAYIRISHLGLRDRERPAGHGKGPRAVVIGDSIVEALQVDLGDTAVAVAEREIERRRPDAEVVNLGLAGANPPVEVARLRSIALSLKSDLALVVVQIGDFLSSGNHDDSGWTGYRPGPDGELRLSYGFRDTQGYRFRTSTGGAVVYWLLDHSALMRVLNSRKNVGIAAEWPTRRIDDSRSAPDVCDTALDTQRALWIGGEPKPARQVLDAFLRDLAQTRSEHRLPIVVAFRGIPAPCSAMTEARRSLIDAIDTHLRQAGLQFVDLEWLLYRKAGPNYVRDLHGFGASGGRGHLNRRGNRVYGEIFADLIERNWAAK